MLLRRADKSVSGVVVDQSGKPVAGASVGASGEGQPFIWPSVATDKDGKFKIDGLVAGRVQLNASTHSPRGHGSTRADAGETDVRIVIGKSTGMFLPDGPPKGIPESAPSDEDF